MIKWYQDQEYSNYNKQQTRNSDFNHKKILECKQVDAKAVTYDNGFICSAFLLSPYETVA